MLWSSKNVTNCLAMIPSAILLHGVNVKSHPVSLIAMLSALSDPRLMLVHSLATLAQIRNGDKHRRSRG